MCVALHLNPSFLGAIEVSYEWFLYGYTATNLAYNRQWLL